MNIVFSLPYNILCHLLFKWRVSCHDGNYFRRLLEDHAAQPTHVHESLHSVQWGGLEVDKRNPRRDRQQAAPGNTLPDTHQRNQGKILTPNYRHLRQEGGGTMLPPQFSHRSTWQNYGKIRMLNAFGGGGGCIVRDHCHSSYMISKVHWVDDVNIFYFLECAG